MADWSRLRLTLPTPLADWAGSEAVDWGSSGVEVVDTGGEEGMVGPAMTLHIYVRADRAGEMEQRLRTFLGRLGEEALPWDLDPPEPVAPVDWARQWRYHFPPLPLGERLLILPPWDAGLDSEGREVIQLQPGMAFGTGHHPTTAMVAEALEELEDLPSSGPLLDVGCGSGILAMAAVRLGVPRALAFDCDRDAVEAARENLRLNEMTRRVCLVQARFPEVPAVGPFPLIVANVYYTFFRQHGSEVASLLAPGGTLLASGLQEEQAAPVARILSREGVEAEVTGVRQEWALVRGVRP
ncbi:MAG: 50S ribosomal protein L11 methyltransferase [bacterium]